MIKEAVRELAQLKQPKKRWPREIEAFLADPQPMKGAFPGFEAYRAKLTMVTANTSEFARISELQVEDWSTAA